MDARNISDRTLDLPTVGVYGIQPGETVLTKAGQYAPIVRADLVAGLLHQGDSWEAADEEASDWLIANPAPADPAVREAKAMRNKVTTLNMRPEQVGLIPMPDTLPEDQPAATELTASRIAKPEAEPERTAKKSTRRSGSADADTTKE